MHSIGQDLDVNETKIDESSDSVDLDLISNQSFEKFVGQSVKKVVIVNDRV